MEQKSESEAVKQGPNMIKVQSRSGGGLILIDRSTLANLKGKQLDDGPDIAGILSIAVDSEGRTDQVNRWTGENWPEVWKRETEPLVEMANKGNFSGVIFRCGDYYCD